MSFNNMLQQFMLCAHMLFSVWPVIQDIDFDFVDFIFDDEILYFHSNLFIHTYIQFQIDKTEIVMEFL